jgi:DNA-binding CsgD family transcriptional regulator
MGQPEIATLNQDFFDAACIRLRAVIDCLGDCGGADEERSERVLMDVDFDGHRYLLVRMPPAARNSHSLSPREVEIVRLVAEGHPNKVIAAVLDISAWTVCTHVRRVFMKLGVTSRAAMVARMAEFARQPQALRGSSAPRARELASASIDPSSFGREGELLAHRHHAPAGDGRPVARRGESAPGSALKRSVSTESVEREHSARRNASR